jgi:Tol biopolymer transport system component
VTAPEAPPLRTLAAGQRARVRVWNRASGTSTTVFETGETLLEAPNWTAEGDLLLNGDGRLWLMPADGSAAPRLLDTPGLPDVNNDHVLSPVGASVFASTNDWQVWEVPLAGGASRRVTTDDGGMHFLHGVRPDGEQLAYVRLDPTGDDWWASATIHTVGTDGSGDTAVTTHPGPADGSEWTPDGAWILFNTEQFSAGHAQLARVRADGSELEQLTFDERVNWFPHIAPTGDVVVYLSYPSGTAGHPADKAVELRLVSVDDWQTPTVLAAFNGGQGTINVPSWAPDGSAFAYVEYPFAEEG